MAWGDIMPQKPSRSKGGMRQTLPFPATIRYHASMNTTDPPIDPASVVRTSLDQRRAVQQLAPEKLAAYQLQRLNELLSQILPANSFYGNKFGSAKHRLESLSDLSAVPYTYKHELLGQDRGFAANLTWPINRYSRFHRTSGTQGRPLTVLDTTADWQWWLETWQPVLDAADLSADDRVVMAFSFGPFIGFWSAFDAAVERGCLVAPTGAMTSIARLELIRSIDATVVFCTPSYALHLVEVAAEHHFNLADLSVRALIVAGEPGGSIPSLRKQIETAWNVTVIDHSGASEVGPWGFPDVEGTGVHVNEAELIAEFISLQSGEPAQEGQLSELVLTTLGRAGSPVVRYRTGDLVRPTWNHNRSCKFVLLSGGVLGRADDMLIIRGVNVFPSAIEEILRSFPEIVEYRLTAFKASAMDQLKIEIEDRLEQPQRVQQELQLRIGLRVEVECVAIGTLPRFEAKGKRFVDQRRLG